MFQGLRDSEAVRKRTHFLRRGLFVIGIIFAGGFVAFWVLFGDLRRLETRLTTQNTALLTEMLHFERATGYGGFIHNFKNAVLRPQETDYLDGATRNLADALDALAGIQDLARATGTDIDLTPTRETLLRYGSMIEILRSTPPGTLTARELDALVRVPDIEAIRNLSELVASARLSVYARLDQIETRILRLSLFAAAASSALLAGWIVVLAILRRRETDALFAIEAASARVQMVLDTTTNGIIALDNNRQIVTANTVARQMLGLADGPFPYPWPDTITFLRAEDLQPLDASADPIRRALAGERLRGEINLITRGDSTTIRYVRLSSGETTTPRGNERPDVPIRVVIVLDDVTEQETNRQKFERASRLDALGQLTGGIAHDFNNILAAIMYSLELSLADPLPGKTREWLERAKNSVKRGADLSRRLLAFAKRNPALASTKPVVEVLREMKLLVRPTIEEAVEIVIECPDESLAVHCDQGQLENALLNLVLNSRDAILQGETGDRILISARAVERPDQKGMTGYETGTAFGDLVGGARAGGNHQRYVEISVTDNGRGMTDEVRRRAIDPFFTTKGSTSGSGLGLSMVYGFIEQSEGELRIYSEVGHGTTIRMLLPRGLYEGDRDNPAERLPVPMGRSERLLIVEDDTSLLAIMQEMVTAIGYRHVSATSGRAALDLIDAGEEFDLLLTDIVMPGGMGGYDLARRVRDRRPDVPIVYMSGYAGLSQTSMGGVVAPSIQKPCSAADLARVLRSGLNGARGT
ncbi:ATP-binding protein [Rhodobacteraceae bacterium DSL-40]|uniref:ATP-binding protein n=1 Tax=Amaricoccus sp. B4 TaxID=3368557 RepID=UPI0013A6C4D2